MVRSLFGSNRTMSASLPGAIVPFCGNSPNSFADCVDVRSTNLFKEIRPFFTPSENKTLKRSSTNGPPFGILEKSSFPRSFWPLKLKEKCSEPIVCNSLQFSSLHYISLLDNYLNECEL